MNLRGLKKIIVVQGQGSSGKSAILNDVCGQLVQIYGNASVHHSKKFVTKAGIDQHLVIDTKAEKRVGVCTPGDDANWIVKVFYWLNSIGVVWWSLLSVCLLDLRQNQ